ncbi:DUF4283 domain protein [Medicago truncatula]|uniref:DUF4283 domain protein n=1 Tax=Medicago truncatula TaxID=3880 RepID=A0A072UF25_MEDTR|nr:DUF4283 domain protein [Medicago truncatula]
MSSLSRGYYEFSFATYEELRAVWALGMVNLKSGVMRNGQKNLMLIHNIRHILKLGFDCGNYRHGYYELCFATYEDLREVWALGMVNLKPSVMRLFEWTKEFNAHTKRHTHTQAWIRLWELPQEYWVERTLYEIARAIGTPLLVDNVTKNRLFGHYTQSTQGWKSKDNLSNIGSSKAFDATTLDSPHPHQKEVHAYHGTDFADGEIDKATVIPATIAEVPKESPKIIDLKNSVDVVEVVQETHTQKEDTSFHVALANVSEEIVWSCFDMVALIEMPILERVTPLEKEMIAERSNTFTSPASSTSVTQIVKLNTGDIFPILHKDLDLLKQVLKQKDENNAPFRLILTKKQHKALNRSAYNTLSKGDPHTISQ